MGWLVIWYNSLYITISSLFSRIFLCFFCKISIFICPKNHSCSWKWRENCRKDFNLEEKTTEISCLSLILFWYAPLKGSKLNKNIIRYSFSHIQQESFLSIYLSIWIQFTIGQFFVVVLSLFFSSFSTIRIDSVELKIFTNYAWHE